MSNHECNREEHSWQALKADALADDFCQGIMHKKTKEPSLLLLIRNKNSIFAESFTRMKQKILERIGYYEHIERMFGRGMISRYAECILATEPRQQA